MEELREMRTLDLFHDSARVITVVILLEEERILPEEPVNLSKGHAPNTSPFLAYGRKLCGFRVIYARVGSGPASGMSVSVFQRKAA